MYLLSQHISFTVTLYCQSYFIQLVQPKIILTDVMDKFAQGKSVKVNKLFVCSLYIF